MTFMGAEWFDFRANAVDLYEHAMLEAIATSAGPVPRLSTNSFSEASIRGQARCAIPILWRVAYRDDAPPICHGALSAITCVACTAARSSGDVRMRHTSLHRWSGD